MFMKNMFFKVITDQNPFEGNVTRRKSSDQDSDNWPKNYKTEFRDQMIEICDWSTFSIL